MSAKIKLLTGIAGLAAAAGLATPASAQYYPQPGYGYGNQGNNNVGQIIGNILGYGRYPYGNYGYNNYQSRDRMAIDQCARAAEAGGEGGPGPCRFQAAVAMGRAGGTAPHHRAAIPASITGGRR